MSDLDELLSVRAKTHGDWRQQAATTQALKEVIRQCEGWQDLLPTQRECLDMVAHKIARVLCGDPHHLDHWDDIAGYAQITAKRLRDDKSFSERREPDWMNSYPPNDNSCAEIAKRAHDVLWKPSQLTPRSRG